jgi:hypothetical protein
MTRAEVLKKELEQEHAVTASKSQSNKTSSLYPTRSHVGDNYTRDPETEKLRRALSDAILKEKPKVNKERYVNIN